MDLQRLFISEPDEDRLAKGKELLPRLSIEGSGDFSVPSNGNGGEAYRVHVEWREDGLHGLCSCEDFTFRLKDSVEEGVAKPCKHLWAVITYIGEHPEAMEPVEERLGAVVEVGAPTLKPPGQIDFSQILPSTEQAAEVMQRYREIKRDVLDKAAFYEVWGPDGKKEILNRRGCSIISMMFQLTEAGEPHITEKPLNGEHTKFRVMVKICAPNGRCSWGIGECTTKEIADDIRKAHDKVRAKARSKGQDPDKAVLRLRAIDDPRIPHDAVARAHSRAKSRSIMDLVGGGEVTPEEMNENPQRRSQPAGRRNGRDNPIGGQEESFDMLAGKLNWNTEQLMGFLSGQLGRTISSVRDLTNQEANRMLMELNRQAKIAESAEV